MSNFHPDTGGRRWSLVQALLSSGASGREGRCRQMSLACVGRTCSAPATLGLPPLAAGAFPVYTAQAPGCSPGSGPCMACGSSFPVLHKSSDSVAPAFCAFPAGAAQAARSLRGALSPGAVRLIPSAAPASVSACASRVRLVCSGELVSSRDPPGGCQPSRISGSLWLETGSLFAVWWGCRLWGRVCPFPLPPASCLWRGWAGLPPASASLELLSCFVL